MELVDNVIEVNNHENVFHTGDVRTSFTLEAGSPLWAFSGTVCIHINDVRGVSIYAVGKVSFPFFKLNVSGQLLPKIYGIERVQGLQCL